MTKKIVRRLTVVALVVVAAIAGLAAPAYAGNGSEVLQLSDGPYGSWTMTGRYFAAGRSDVQVWVMDTTGGGWTTLEYQSGITTTVPRFGPCSTLFCAWVEGGRFTASGALSKGMPGGFGPYPYHPLTCGRSYRPVAYDPVDGYVYGPTLDEPACPVLH